MSSLISVVGMLALLALAFACSENKKKINLRTVGLALLLQIGLGGFVLYVPLGGAILESASGFIANILAYGQDGISFMFGDLGTMKLGFVFAFNVLPVVIFFSSLVAVAYYLGVMGWIIRVLGGGLRLLLKTSRAESMCATANIFVGHTEAPLVVKPFIASMTRSELFALMTGGAGHGRRFSFSRICGNWC